jgi:hypothetical protein
MPFAARARFVLANDGDKDYAQNIAYGFDCDRIANTPPREAVLRFESINLGGKVYINDQEVDQVKYSLFPAEVDLTSFVMPGAEYTLRVRCYSLDNEWKASRDYPGSQQGMIDAA